MMETLFINGKQMRSLNVKLTILFKKWVFLQLHVFAEGVSIENVAKLLALGFIGQQKN